MVSILVAVYNVEKYVEKCIKSILNQTYKNIELILVNDGSTDNSLRVIMKYLNDTRCVIVNNQHKGLAATRNVGLEHAKGEFVLFVDSDDYLAENAVELLVNKMIESKSDFCCYRFYFISEKTSKARLHGKDFQFEVLNDNNKIVCDAFSCENIKVTVWSKFFRRDFLEKNHLSFYEKVGINEDALFTIESSLYAERVGFLNIPLYYALERSNSGSRTMQKENITSYFILTWELKNILENENRFDIYQEYFWGNYTKQILFTLVQSAFRMCLKDYLDIIFSELIATEYMDKKIGKNIRKFSIIYWFLYQLSLSPVFFYWSMQFLKRIGVKMY
ncbi:hypothetical protein AGMMS49546_38800 [Spirochaetia bacterium]|nr:hypothetical protein AGMMS49546_38800 [Spirochaetia bacterium]